MFLTDKEKEMFNKLGFEVRDGKIAKQASPPNLHYMGFNLYWDSNEARVFEKVGETLQEYHSPELDAERRFLKNIATSL